MTKQVLIFSGPTHEYLDPVRFLGNASSGKMGKAIAENALLRKYKVEFISGPVLEINLPEIASSHLHRVTSAREMLDAGLRLACSADILIFAAAVADFAPVERLNEKITRTTGGLVLHLQATPDIAKTLCENKTAHQIAIGFALQTADGEVHARRKLLEKNLDGIILNTPATLGAESGNFRFLSTHTDRFTDWGIISKQTCAENLFRFIESR